MRDDDDLHLALADMLAARAAGRLAYIGPPSRTAEIQNVLLRIPDLPAEIIRWCELCSYAVFEWVRILGPASPDWAAILGPLNPPCPEGGTTLVDYLDLISVPARRAVGMDKFGCIYCVDTSASDLARPIFLTEFASDEVMYHVASSFPKFLRLVARAIINDNPDWEEDKDFILSIDPELEDVPNAELPWVVLREDDEYDLPWES